MKGLVRIAAALAASTIIVACTPTRSVVVQRPSGAYGAIANNRAPAPHGSYRVVKGDALYSIAFRHGVDFRSLAAWNGITSPYTIWPGQLLRLGPPGNEAAVSRAPRALAAKQPAPGSLGKLPLAIAPGTTPTQTKPMFEPVATATATAPAASASSLAAAQRPPVAAFPLAGKAPAATQPSAPAPPTVVPAATGGTRSVDGVTWRWPADGQVFKKFQSGDAIPGIEIAGRSGQPIRAAAEGVVVYSGNGLVGYGELVIVKHSDSFLSAYGHNSKRLVKEGQRVSAGQEIAEMGSTGAPRDELQFQIRKNGNPVDPLLYLPGRQ